MARREKELAQMHVKNVILQAAAYKGFISYLNFSKWHIMAPTIKTEAEVRYVGRSMIMGYYGTVKVYHDVWQLRHERNPSADTSHFTSNNMSMVYYGMVMV